MLNLHLKTRLLAAIISTLVIAQFTTAIWLWHETQEQIEILSRTDITAAEAKALIHFEQWESLFAFIIPTLICVVLTALIVYWLIGRLTRPLEVLTGELGRRTVHELTPLSAHNGDIEIQHIVISINDLFLRISQGFEHERAFAMDVAHELRTPLAGIRMHLELLQATNPERIKPLITRLDDIILLTVQLLDLARASQQKRSGQLMSSIDLTSQVCLPLQNEYSGLNNIYWQLPEQALTIANDSLLRVALKNLLDNAVKYAGTNACIEVTLSLIGDDYLLQVEDNGEGVSAHNLTKITETFFRADQRGPGYGVGLSIVKRIAELHSGTLTLNQGEHQGLIAKLKFPKTLHSSAHNV